MPRPSKSEDDKKVKKELSVTQFNNHYKLQVYNGTLFYFDNGKWESFNRYPNDSIISGVIKDMANEYAFKNNMTTEKFSANSARAKAYRNSNDSADLDFKGIVFRNGYVDKEGFTKTYDLPFTPTQVPIDFKEVPKLLWNPTLIKFFKKISGNDKKWFESYIRLLSTCLDNQSWTVFGILYSQSGGTGKSVILALLQNILGTSNFTKIDGKNVFDGKNNFALRGINNVSMIVINEMQEKLPGYASEKIKTMADNDYVPYESKGSNRDKVKMLGTVIATTNYSTQFNEIEDALTDRVQRWEFKNNKEDLTPEEWLELWKPNDNMKQTLLTLLVKSYITLCNDNSSMRGYKFDSGETKSLWHELEASDVIINWIIKNQDELHGGNSNDIYKQYCEAQSYDTSLPKVTSANTISKKVNKIMKAKRVSENGKKVTKYFIKELNV